MAKKKKGMRVGGYKIRPLGIVVLALILLIIIACVVFFVGKPFEVGGGGFLSPSATPSPTPVPTPTPTPSPTPEPTPRSATIRSLGEIAMQDNLLAAAKGEGDSYDFSAMFSEVDDVMGAADYTIADVEGSLGGTVGVSGGTQMLTPPSLIQTLANCGVDMLNLANDHALDGGWDDLQASIQNCLNAGMQYVGAATTLMERNTAKVLDINGIRVGFVAYTESLNGLESKAGDALEYGINLAAKTSPSTDIQACRDAGAEIVVACVSWGELFNRNVTKNQQSMAQVLVQSGADVILGYNPHVIQRAMWIELTDKSGNVTKRALCLLSHGNFLSDARQQYADSGVIFQFTLREKEDYSGIEVVEPKYIPTYVWRIENTDEDGETVTGYDYRTLACGQWLENAPEGMNYTQESRIRAVWAEAQSIMGSDVAEVANQ